MVYNILYPTKGGTKMSNQKILIVDDENVFVSDELLKGLDKELNEFLADLMKD